MVKLTDYSATVYEVQSALRAVSSYNNEIQPKVVPDGVYGEETAQAVASFQRYIGIEETGKVDYRTWQALFGNEY